MVDVRCAMRCEVDFVEEFVVVKNEGVQRNGQCGKMRDESRSGGLVCATRDRSRLFKA